MIRSASVYTLEIDDLDAALSDIQAQLAQKLTLLTHTAGIIHCSGDFIESGVAAHISNSLPFPVVGSTTSSQAVNKTYGMFMLTLLVLTSDDVVFVPACTSGLTDDFNGAMAHSFPSQKDVPDMPLKMVLAFPPLKETIAGDSFVHAFENLCGSIPVFGAFAVEEEIMTYARHYVICNETCAQKEMSYLLIYGNVNPRFFISNVPQRSKALLAGKITSAEKNILHEVNGIRAIDYFKSIGFVQNDALKNGVEFIPFVLTLQDEDGNTTQFVRALTSFDANGSAVCRGYMYEAAELTIGSHTAADIITASRDTVTRINAAENA